MRGKSAGPFCSKSMYHRGGAYQNLQHSCSLAPPSTLCMAGVRASQIELGKLYEHQASLSLTLCSRCERLYVCAWSGSKGRRREINFAMIKLGSLQLVLQGVLKCFVLVVGSTAAEQLLRYFFWVTCTSEILPAWSKLIIYVLCFHKMSHKSTGVPDLKVFWRNW